MDEVNNEESSEEFETPEERVRAFAKSVNYEVKDTELLRTALTHRSFTSENPGFPNNERLEFLGDAVLDLVLSDMLFVANPNMPEGELAKARSAVVNEDTLYDVAVEIELGRYMFFGIGEARSGGSKKKSILADCLEAVIAAIYLDSDYVTAREFVVRQWDERAKQSANNPGITDYKTRFQEAIVKYNSQKPRYVVKTHGPEHDRFFTAHLFAGDKEMGTGHGKSKKVAEQDAAKNALEYLEKLT